MPIYEIDNLPAPVKFSGTNATLVRTLQNAKNLLMTHMGEVPYDRYRGFNPALYDLPVTELKAKLPRELDRVMMWEPDVEVAYAECVADKYGNVIIKAGLEIKLIN